MKREMPHHICPRIEFGELLADVAAQPWCDLAAMDLRDIATGLAPKQGTAVRTAWDGREWRVLFHCVDADPWATLTQRDAPLYQEETVEVFFDPVGDLQSYFEIEVNPLGTQLDIVFRRSRSGYKGDWAWDCEGLRSLVKIGKGTWTAELAIPFASVAEMPYAGRKWRVNFCRIDRPSRDGSLPRELTAWSPPMRESFHSPTRFGVVEFG